MTTLEEIVIDTGGDPYGSGEKWRPEPNIAGYDIAFIHNDSLERVYSHTEVYHATKARLQNKPGWEGSPEWAAYLGQSSSGCWFWYQSKPIVEEDDGAFGPNFSRWEGAADGQVIGDWRDTLEARPVELQYDPDDVAFKSEEKTMKTVSDAWNGDGLPPVGWHGECTWGTKSKWCECVVLPAGAVAWRSGSRSPWETYEHGDVDFSFRPLQSERERWVTEAMKQCRTLSKHDCEAIYDAGLGRLPQCKN